MHFVIQKWLLVMVIASFTNLSAASDQDPSNIWAVLVAGSMEFFNYRHQADICHAYQLLVRNGVPRDQIIVLMYDDIAYNELNPVPGELINHINGSNVYKGVQIDYKGDDVTPTVFKNILLGNETALKGIGTGRVMKSTKENHVFINFADHGGAGVVSFPGTELHARDFIRTLERMHKEERYGKMVIYIEACESGSMFQNLLSPHLNIFATTAANSIESSFGCYYDDYRGTMLGDTYSVNWMENSDVADLTSETLQRQYTIVKLETNESHVQEFGDMSLRNLFVSNFLGSSVPQVLDKATYSRDKTDQVDAREVVKEIFKRKLAKAKAGNDTEAIATYSSSLRRLNKLRKIVRSEMLAILREVTKNDRKEMETLLTSHLTITNWDCYERVAKAFSKECFSIAKNSYVSGRLFILVNLCERGWETERILSAMSHTCQHKHITGIH